MNESRLPLIDLVRTVCILTVLAVHVSLPGIAALPASGALATGWERFSRNGTYGVFMFFLLSGFLITRMTELRESDFFRLSLRRFYLRRAGRILPLYLAVVLLSTLLLALGPFSPQWQFCYRHPGAQLDGLFWLSLFTVSYNWVWIGRGVPSGLAWDVFWSLAIEEQFYLLYPLAIRLAGTWPRLVAMLVAVAVAGPWLQWRLSHSVLMSVAGSFLPFAEIALGALLYLGWSRSRPFMRRRPRLQWALCLSGLVSMGLVYWHTSLFGNPVHTILGPCLLGLSLGLFLLGGLEIAWLQRLPRWTVEIGQLSYGCYLLHALGLFMLWPILEHRPIGLAYALLILATLALARLSYNLLERPANRRIRAWAKA